MQTWAELSGRKRPRGGGLVPVALSSRAPFKVLPTHLDKRDETELRDEGAAPPLPWLPEGLAPRLCRP